MVGVDGGGTGCRAAVSRDGDTILAQAVGGPANVTSDFEVAIRNIRQAIEDAAAKAAVPKEELAAACVHLGLAGVMNDEMACRTRQALPYSKVSVTDDRPTAVIGALGDGDGFLVAVGTGTITASKRRDIIRYVGGWGFYVADQASGAWLGRRLLEETLLCHDKVKAHSALTRAALADFGGDPNKIVSFSFAAKPGDFGRLAPDIVAAAQAGDDIGARLMKEGASFLEDGLRALGFQPGDRLCLSGGLGNFYRSFLAPEFSENLVAPLGTSVSGAIHLAARTHVQTPGEPS